MTIYAFPFGVQCHDKSRIFYFCSAFCAFVRVELRENLSKLGQNLKQSLIDSAMKTWQSINDFALAHCYQTPGEADATVAESTEVKGNKRMRQNPFYRELLTSKESKINWRNVQCSI